MMNFQRLNKTKALKYSVCSAAMMLSLNACLPNDNAASDYKNHAEFVEAQTEYYTNAISEYALKSSHALTNAAGWATSSIPEGTLDLASADLGSLDLGDTELFIESAYCETTGGNAQHYTWFDTSDDAGNFAIKGLGAGDTGYLVGALQTEAGINNVGVYESGAIEMGDGSSNPIPGGCGSLNIPEGAPVIVTALSLPNASAGDSDSTRYEYRTVSCASGEVGSIQQQLQVTYKATGGLEVNGANYNSLAEIPATEWVEISDNCTSVEEKDSYEVSVGMTTSAVDFAALSTAAGTDSVAATLQASLQNMECNEVVKKIQDGEEVENAEQAVFDTCGTTVDIAALATIETSSAVLVETEIVTQPCTDVLGGAECFDDSVSGDLGEACADAWTGDAVLQRETWEYTYSTSGDTGPGCTDCTTVETVDQWYGLSLECSRYAQLTIECETRLPEYADSTIYTDIDTTGFIYDRSNNVSGWADAENLIPNAPDNPTWTGFDWGCSWQKDVEFACADFTETQDLTSVRDGAANRMIEVLNLAATNIDVSDWTVTQTAECSDSETWDCSEVSGSTQIQGGAAERIVEIQSPEGGFDDSGWTTTQAAQCRLDRDFTCPAGVLVQTGLQERIIEVLDADGTLDESDDWTTTQNSICTDSRETFGCEQRVEERTYTGTAPYEGSWSGWTTVSLVDNCGGSGGGSGGGGDVCIMAGARVAMADGTTKDIAKLEVGDMTIAGRVLETFARHYDQTRHTTSAGIMLVGEGLFNVDGIVGTGRHAFLSAKGWTELSEASEAELERHDVAMLYNTVMENHVLPLVGDSGEVYYYADEMNNIDGLSERAMQRMMASEKMAA